MKTLIIAFVLACSIFLGLAVWAGIHHAGKLAVVSYALALMFAVLSVHLGLKDDEPTN
jgi:hypothetical protein